MFKQLSSKELQKIYSERPWINKNALTNLFLSAFAEAVIPAMDQAMEKMFKILTSTEFIAKIEEDVIDESIQRVIAMIKDDLRKDLVKGMLFDE
ncbi:MAG: hypothetical protein ACTSXO_08280 [Candidatus Heimdallarchaeota archaeon]|nr:MAG: hypothetical protein DRO63_04250 [Candidatus Gerdarchaeota archaeon]RLI69378.1 MAG: hypothetical protein DRP02_10720 [Candidatus Gerdarchaeota archaeon]RLI70062.1 MAG: hypothetical protein DRO91_07135 [Candidatus Heimdallarchaeota archaeon]